MLEEFRMSPLFWLPRELRDQIYMYVLYDAHGLLYKPAKDGTSILSPRSVNLPSRKSILAWLHRASLGRTFARRTKIRRDFNQLKYVCRQLHDETKGLDLHQNLVIFQDICSWNAIEQCVSLFHHWPKLRQVAIRCSLKTFSREFGKSNLSAIMKHCMENSNVSVRVHIPYWSQADPNFVLRGLAYLLTLRKDARLIAQLARETSVSYLSDSEIELFTTNAQIPCNLRWHPWEEEFDRLLLDHNARQHPLLSMPSAQAAVGGLEELAAGWFRYGL
ncbi:hypothetical protein IQ07DRAFT_669108 [Pyrenochaeta sp. DS3sAY3a]|nr:hypothetical protein IQ07DRAFT_669108 [Pyrenochaeta sp. DS3sAY3a]